MTIYLVRKNADFIEGRGPIVVETAFTTLKDARNYVDSQPGIMGVRGVGWDITPLKVHEDLKAYQEQIDDEARVKALSKLTRREKELLGLARKD